MKIILLIVFLISSSIFIWFLHLPHECRIENNRFIGVNSDQSIILLSDSPQQISVKNNRFIDITDSYIIIKPILTKEAVIRYISNLIKGSS